MAAEPLPPEHLDEDEEGGGPVKPFLEHLEDLRWTIIKVVSALLIAMVACLVAGDRLFKLLSWPLVQAQRLGFAPRDTAVLKSGESVIGKLSLATLDTNLWAQGRPSTFNVGVAQVGSNLVLVAVADTNSFSAAADPGLVVIKGYGPLSAISVALELALFGGLTLAAPFVLVFIGQFVIPALHKHEKRFVYRALGIGIGLFVIGVVFAYFVIMQVTLVATVQFAQWMGLGSDEWRADEYVDFVLKMMLAVGLSFQLPVILLTLVRIGILDYQRLSGSRSYFIVANMVACAVITPSGDPFTMLLLAVPVQVLYEISVFIAWTWWKREQKELAALESGSAS